MDKQNSILLASMTLEDNAMLALRLQAAADKAAVDRVIDYPMHEAERKAAAALFKLVEAQAMVQIGKLEKELVKGAENV